PIIISHYSYFFFTATATTNIYTLSLHDALPIYQKKDGSVIDVEVSWHRLNFSGRPAKLVLANDVTERQRAEEALAAERNLLRTLDRKSTRLNSSHDQISYAVFCLKKKKKKQQKK